MKEYAKQYDKSIVTFIKVNFMVWNLKRGTHYELRGKHVHFKYLPEPETKNKITRALINSFPQVSFIWETPRTLRWE